MRFFILFLLCLLASGPLGAGSAQAAPQKGFLPQILDSVEGLSPCKPGGRHHPGCGPVAAPHA